MGRLLRRQALIDQHEGLLNKGQALTVAAFVRTAYQELLGRRPDPQAEKRAVEALENGVFSRRQLLQNIASSVEYHDFQWVLKEHGDLVRDSKSTNSAFVEAAYWRLLERRPTAESLEQDADALRNGALSRERYLCQLFYSEERRALAIIKSLYKELLQREPTLAERWDGVEILVSSQLNPEPLRRVLLNATEYYFRQTEAPPNERPFRAPMPTEIFLELTTRCNMIPPCIICGHATAPRHTKWHDMDPAVWQNLLPLLRQASFIGLHGSGEPLLYPHWNDLLNQLDPERSEIGFHTNGHLLTETVSQRLIKQGIGWISVSMDAASRDMYLRIRRQDTFDKLLEKIRYLIHLRKQMGRSKPWVEINMTVMVVNLPEAPRFVKLAADLGVDRVMFQQLQPGHRWVLDAPDGYLFDYEKEELSNRIDMHQEMMSQAWEKAQQFGIPMIYDMVYESSGASWPSRCQPVPSNISSCLQETITQLPCYYPWKHMIVTAEGDITFCCNHIGKMVLGSALRTSGEEIWNGPWARTFRLAMTKGEVPTCCEGCYIVAR
jgi:MoaA/NifB/PqqE/SkfB family radical SAM enzyme